MTSGGISSGRADTGFLAMSGILRGRASSSSSLSPV